MLAPALQALWLCLAAAGGTSALPPAPPLSPGAYHEQSLAAGESLTFEARLAAGRPYLLTVEQRGIHVAIEVHGPDGSDLGSVESALDRWGIVAAVLRPDTAGAHSIAVRAERPGVGPGRCRIHLEEAAEATPATASRLAGWAAMTQAGRQLHREPGGKLAAVFASLETAERHFHAAADQPGEAEAVAALAVVAHRLGQPRQAVELSRRAVALWQDLGVPEREMQAWTELGLISWELSDLPAADDAFRRGEEIAHRLGSAYHEVDLRTDRCLVQQARGEVQPALACYRETRSRFHELGESRDEATLLNNLGFAHFQLGEPQPAEESYRQALALRRTLGDRAGEAQVLNNLAVLHRSLGEVDEALRAYGEAREILATLDDRRQEAAVLNNLGVAYSTLGELDRARLYLTRALELRRAVVDRRGEIATLNNLGWLARRSDDTGASGASNLAISLYRQALAAARDTADARNEALTRAYLGEAEAAAGRTPEALAELDQALALLTPSGDRYNRALVLRRKGEVLTTAGRPAEALPLFAEALATARAVGDRFNEAITLAARARARRDLGAPGALEAAENDAQDAIAALESLRGRLGNPELRATFLGSRSDIYELPVDLLMRLDAARPGQGFDRAAFEASERARARALLDVLQESGARLPATGDPELETRRRDLERRLALKDYRRQSLLVGGGGGGGGKGRAAEIHTLEIESEEIRADLDTVEAEIRRRNPRFAELTRATSSTAAEIQALLDPGTLLLEYSLGRERSYLWAVEAGALRTFVLPGRAQIETAARAFHQALSTPATGRDDGGRRRLGATLSRILLAPLSGTLAERRLAIVPDGALDYIPFDVLPEPGGAGGPTPLLARHEVVVLPSASVLAAGRRDFGRREPAPALALVLADPVFQPGDPRVARRLPPGATAGEPASLSPLSRLRFSRREAAAITALAPGKVETALDFAADRDLVLSGRLSAFRYLHFATHGVFDAEHPELSGLVLSRVDAAGQPRQGLLRLRDIYGLHLAADVVVLSGCGTALGKEIRGEGLVGLTRGFLYAGAARVVASLWWIDDRATAVLMAAFYRGLWVDGLRPAAALRQARLALARRPRFRDPAYWGGFELQGDWQ